MQSMQAPAAERASLADGPLAALLEERGSAMDLLQRELQPAADTTGAAAGEDPALLQAMGLATAEDLLDVAGAGSIEELELALLRLQAVCGGRLQAAAQRDQEVWRSLRTKYNIGVCVCVCLCIFVYIIYVCMHA
jgi:hypothetical protein